MFDRWGAIAPGAAAPHNVRMAEGDRRTGFGRGFLRDAWYFAALAEEIRPGRMRRHELLGEPVLIGRTPAGEILALRDI
jgi:hypothetical protein